MVPREQTDFYEFQRLVGRALLGWGAVNALAGALFQTSTNSVTKQFGLQALVWGAIDALIALVGLRDARRKQAAGAEPALQARRFRLIVAVNTLLDVGYIAGGFALLRRAGSSPDRAGVGVGVIVQGAFLLLFDAALTLLSGRWTSGE